MKAGMRYRHINCLDVDIEVERIRYVGPNYIIVNLAYLNRNWQGGDFLIDRERNVRIMRKDLRNWKPLEIK